MPLISVCIPTWNGGRYLARTLESLLAQDEGDLEILVCDDGSTDDTVAVAGGFSDPRIHVRACSDRLGLAGNWNRAISLAEAPLVCLFGQDDTARPEWSSELVGLLGRHPDANLAFGRRTFVFEDEESRAVLGPFFEHEYPAMLAPFYERTGERIEPREMIEEAMRHRFMINLIGEPSFVVVRRDHPAVREGFDPAMSQMLDWEFHTRFFHDAPIVRTDVVIGEYHLHDRGASKANLPLSTHFEDYRHLLVRVLARFAQVLAPDERVALDEALADATRQRDEWIEREARS